MERVVELHKAVVLLDQFPALAGADLEVRSGEILLLQGPNGAGKSTLLRTLAGLLPLSAGTLSVFGHDLCKHPRAARSQTSLLGHSTALYDDLSVVDNVDFWARANGASPNEARRALVRVDLDPRLREVSVERLSAGQRRRLALAIVVATRPRLWLLDEPHAGLDAESRDLLDSLLIEATEAGATVVFASHELDRALSVATRVVKVVAGHVEAAAEHKRETDSDRGTNEHR
ncbi:MAG: heme ABC exporter ATP-binding protein CcmA [Acidimicrobiales bacterium]